MLDSIRDVASAGPKAIDRMENEKKNRLKFQCCLKFMDFQFGVNSTIQKPGGDFS